MTTEDSDESIAPGVRKKLHPKGTTARRVRHFLSKIAPPTWKTAVVLSLVVLCVWRFWYMRTAGNWDFMVYYWAAKAQRAGLDPYNLYNLSRVAGQKVVLRFLYPPTILFLLRPLTHVPLQTAIAIYVVLKIACLVGLVFIWRAFLEARDSLVLFVLVIFGFSNAVFNDLFAGNIATFEAFVLWLAFYCLVRGRSILFATLVLLASTAKLTPVFFLPLILLLAGRRRFLIFASASVVGLISPFLAFGGIPSRLWRYLQMVGGVDERGPTNSAILPLLKDVHEYLIKRNAPLASVSPTALYATICVVVLAVTAVALFCGLRSGRLQQGAMRDGIMGMVISYALLLPRFKDYSYCLLIPAVVFVGRRLRNAIPIVVLLASLTTRNTLARYAVDDFPLADLVWRYFNLLVVIVLWLGFVGYIWRKSSSGLFKREIADTVARGDHG
jgi:hypothetical protein